MKFRNFAAGALAAALLFGLAACRAADEPEETPDDPAQEEPVQTDPAGPDDAGAAQPDAGGGAEPDEPSDGGEGEPSGGEAASVTPQTGGDAADSWSLPQVTVGDEQAGTTINDYYDAVADKYAGYAAGGEDGVSADYTVTYNSGHVLSVRREVSGGEHGETVTLYAETFNTDNGGLLVAGDFFTVDEDTWTARLIELVIETLGEPALSWDGWEDDARAAFDRDNFYLTETGYVVFYQAGAISRGGPVEVEIPYDDIADIFVMP